MDALGRLRSVGLASLGGPFHCPACPLASAALSFSSGGPFPRILPSPTHDMGCCLSKAGSGSAGGEEALELPEVGIPPNAKGKDVEVDAATLSMRGTGSALASAPIEQDQAYWEVHVLEPGEASRVRVGVSRRLKEQELSRELEDTAEDAPRVWSFQHDGLRAGDVIGVTFGQSDLPNLSFALNGSPQPTFDVKKIGGLVYPVFSVARGAAIRVVFDPDKFEQQPPPTAKPLMVVRSLL